MTSWRRAARRDENAGEIVAALEAAGAVVDRDRSLDLIVGYGQRIFRFVVRNGKRKSHKSQLDRISLWQSKGLPVYVIRTPAEALRGIGEKTFAELFVRQETH